MQPVVALIVIVGLAAVAARFLFRAGEGRAVRLPRIVDDSIGMWALRRMTGRPLGDRRMEAAAAERAARPRSFDAVMARRLGMRRAGELAPRKRAAGAWLEPGPQVGPPQSRRLSRLAIGVLAIAAVVVGLAVGAGIALLVPPSSIAGTSGQLASPSAPPASATRSP